MLTTKWKEQVEEIDMDIKPAIEKSNLNSLVYVNGGIRSHIIKCVCVYINVYFGILGLVWTHFKIKAFIRQLRHQKLKTLLEQRHTMTSDSNTLVDRT